MGFNRNAERIGFAGFKSRTVVRGGFVFVDFP